MRPTPGLPLPYELGPYRLERLLGRGGMGEVFEAWDERLQRHVAIKRLHRETSAQPDSRLLREARAAAGLDHPAIVQIFDVLDQENHLWVVMEHLEGCSVADALRQRGRLSIESCLSLANDVASGLAAAHARGLVHRDLKTENVMHLDDGRFKIVDFGIAKLTTGREVNDLTTGDRVVGTARSMAPEQALGRPADARSDLFSFGVLLYEALTASSPFLAETANETLVKICSHHPPPVTQLRPEIPGNLSTLVSRLMDKDPTCRPPDSDSAIRLLSGELTLSNGSGLSRDTLGAEATEVNIEPVASSAHTTWSGLERFWRHRAAIAILAISVLGLAWFVARDRPLSQPIEPLTPQRVAVDVQEPADGPATLQSIVEVGLQRALLARPGLIVVAADLDQALPAEPSAAATLLGVDTLVRGRLRCRAEVCRTVIQRWDNLGGLEGVNELSIPVWEPSLAHEALQLAIDRLFDDHPRTGARLFSKTDSKALQQYFTLRHAFESGEWAEREEALLENIAKLRLQAPQLIETYIFEADLLTHSKLRNADNLIRASSVLKAAMGVAPSDPRPAFAAVRVAFSAGDLELAEDLLVNLETSQPGHPFLLRYRATLAAEQGKTEAAVRFQQAAVARQPSLKNQYRLATLLHRAGHVDQARAALDRLLSLDGQHLSGLWLQAQLELLHGEPKRAAELYEQLSHLRPHFVVWANLGVAQLLSGNLEAAVDHLRQALEIRPENASVHLNLADALALLGHHDQARENYLSVLEAIASGTDGEAWQRLSISAQAHAHLDEKVLAAEEIAQALRLAPDSPQLAYEASLVYTLLDERSSASAHALRARRLGIAAAWFNSPWFQVPWFEQSISEP